MQEIMSDDTSIKRGSRNLCADLGYADPETHLLKAGLVSRIQDIIGLSVEDQQPFAAVLIDPPPPNDATLQRAVRHQREGIQQR